MNLNKTSIAILLLLLFYTVGLFGLQFESTKELFLKITPFNLLLTMGLVLWVHNKRNTEFAIVTALIILTGYFIELAGVHTGRLFGVYTYGKGLGFQLFSVPLIIGVNWFILSYAVRGTMIQFFRNIWVQIILGALIMVGLDYVMEPVAIKLDFWAWEKQNIPIENYLMWFAVALFMQFILSVWAKKMNKRISMALLVIQFFFFGILNLLL
mgnify:CR=1 FL=1|jgi:putative membrane protein